MEFSPNGNFLYFSNGNNSIIQLNLSAEGYPQTGFLDKISPFTEFQLGPDGNIYVSSFRKDYLSIIKDPNTAGLSVMGNLTS